jgi:hypothetical protein
MKREGEDGMEWWNPVARRCLEMTLLALVGGWAYFANLHLSLLEGSEGLYAGIAGEMGRRREFFDLTYQRMYRTSISRRCSFGCSISRHRYGATTKLPCACPVRWPPWAPSCLTYVLGSQAGVVRRPDSGRRWSVATSHVFLWYGRRVLFDSTLTFLVTLALFAWIQVHTAGAKLTLVSARLRQHGSRCDVERRCTGFFCRCSMMALYAAIQRDTLGC